MTQDITQCDSWKLSDCGSQIGDHVLDALVHLLLPISPEVVPAEILRIEAAFGGESACETTFVERHTDDDPDVVLLTSWKECVFWALLKNIVDDLNRIHQASF